MFILAKIYDQDVLLNLSFVLAIKPKLVGKEYTNLEMLSQGSERWEGFQVRTKEYDKFIKDYLIKE